MTETTLEGGTVRCSCGKFYRIEFIGGLTRVVVNITRNSDPQQDLGSHECPDNRFRWIGGPV